MRAANSLLSAIPTTIFTVMSALAAQHDAINLGQGFPDTEGPQDIVQAAADALLDGRNQYPPLAGLPELREAVAACNRRFYGLSIDPLREVVVTSGATEALTASLMALVDPGDEVVLIEPFYDTYLPVVRLLGGVPRVVRLREPAAGAADWALPLDDLAAVFGPRTKAILLNTPMNPTGKVFSREELGIIADLVIQHDAYAICDEVYEHLTFAPARHVPLMTLPGMRDRCIRIGSAGKSFSLTGWKVGYATASEPLAGMIAKAHQNLTFTTPPNLQRAVALGLSKDLDYFEALSVSLAGRRDLLAEGLRGIGFDVLPCSGSYFIIADFRPLGLPGEVGRDAMAFCRFITERARVAAIPVSAFYDGANPPAHLVRFAFCKREVVLREAIARLGVLFGCEPRLPIDAIRQLS